MSDWNPEQRRPLLWLQRRFPLFVFERSFLGTLEGMFYVGYFTWYGEKPEILTDNWPKGAFSCFVEADSVDEAGDKLRTLIEDLKGWAVPFESVAIVHFDDLIEVKKLPEEGVLAQITQVNEEMGGVSYYVLPGVSSEFCEAYRPTKGNDVEEEDGSRTEGPFISFVEEDN